MARKYRKVDPRTWTDEKFSTLTDSEKLLLLYVMTCQQCNRVGIFRFSTALAAEDLNTSAKCISDRFAKVCDTFRWKWDANAKVVYIPTWWKYNHPENPKHLIGCLEDLDDLPATKLADEFAANTSYLSPNLLDTFAIRIAKRMPYQELELEQELEQESGGDSVSEKPADPMPEVPEAVSQIWGQWISYKSERREAYKPQGLRAAITHLRDRFEEIGPSAVKQKIMKAMASGWKGWDHDDDKQSKSAASHHVPNQPVPTKVKKVDWSNAAAP